MTCNEVNCEKFSCALCYDCQQSLCVDHIIDHHNSALQRHLSFYDTLRQLYKKLRSMSIEQCYQQVFRQISSDHIYSSDRLLLFDLRSIREELIEQLTRFKQKHFYQLQQISGRLHDRKQMMDSAEASDVQVKLEEIQSSINSLTYGIHLDMCEATRRVQCRKIFHHERSMRESVKSGEMLLQKSSSWTTGLHSMRAPTNSPCKVIFKINGVT